MEKGDWKIGKETGAQRSALGRYCRSTDRFERRNVLFTKRDLSPERQAGRFDNIKGRQDRGQM